MTDIKLPIQYYQRVLLEETFLREDIPVLDICARLLGLLPPNIARLVLNNKPVSKEDLKSAITAGGSCAFEQLVYELQRSLGPDSPSYPSIAKDMTNHDIKQFFRFAWIWSEDGHVMRRGGPWFTDKAACREEGKNYTPTYFTCDRPHAPVATLCVEALCPCYVHMADQGIFAPIGIPCRCFGRAMPAPVKKPFILQPPRFIKPGSQLSKGPSRKTAKTFELLAQEAMQQSGEKNSRHNKTKDGEKRWKIAVDGLMVLREPTTTNLHKYRIRETGERFYSSKEDINGAYEEYKKSSVLFKINPFKWREDLPSTPSPAQ